MPRIDVTEEGFYIFLDISVFLTGFGRNELLATGMHETYYYTIMKEPDQDNVRAFFNKAESLMKKYGKDEKKLIKEIANELIPESQYQELAKRIILLWYTGIWTTFHPTITKVSEMVCPEAYEQGLIWAAAETHPAGARQPGYDSWSKRPL
jgi:arsenate reductase-like glutaredoxin family protein